MWKKRDLEESCRKDGGKDVKETYKKDAQKENQKQF